MKLHLLDIYYIKDTECAEIVQEYRIHRGCFNNLQMDEGLQKLYEKSVEIFTDMKKHDFYYKERILVEALTFLQHLICFQKRAINEWRQYYERMLDLFHKHRLLLFKPRVIVPKNYIHKEDACVVTMMDNDIKLHYKTAHELSQDFGRYRSDLIIKETKSCGKNIDFSWILTLLL